jgi:hypothetical protein
MKALRLTDVQFIGSVNPVEFGTFVWRLWWPYGKNGKLSTLVGKTMRRFGSI